MIIFIR